MLRGVRGAISVEKNSKNMVCERTMELLTSIVSANAIKTEDIGAVIFSSTPDLSAEFPAKAARMMGWSTVPLFGAQELECDDGLARCVRVLILWNTQLPQQDIKHIYLGEAAVLRQDIISK